MFVLHCNFRRYLNVGKWKKKLFLVFVFGFFFIIKFFLYPTSHQTYNNDGHFNLIVFVQIIIFFFKMHRKLIILFFKELFLVQVVFPSHFVCAMIIVFISDTISRTSFWMLSIKLFHLSAYNLYPLLKKQNVL